MKIPVDILLIFFLFFFSIMEPNWEIDKKEKNKKNKKAGKQEDTFAKIFIFVI